MATAEEIGKSSCRVTRGVHRGQAGDRNGVEPREDVGREELVGGHGRIAVPEEPERLGVLHLLPVEALEGLDRGEGAPVDRFYVPDADGAHDAADAVPEQPDRDDGQDDRGRAQGHVVEEVLRREDDDALGRVGRRRCRDGAHGVFLQVPRPVVEEGDEPDP
ncbi:hypothetical protein SLS62_000636 [Diatrype stigma]|uniref:Uncharacterized protein n=1 Tax=Diatrype stigma TaxID=117547 RepID=A0AAN9V1Q4_9PEZI